MKIFYMLNIRNGSRGFGGPLNEQETIDFLTIGKLNIYLRTLDKKGCSDVHPAWYYCETSKQAKNTCNIRKNVYFCIDDPNPLYK